MGLIQFQKAPSRWASDLAPSRSPVNRDLAFLWNAGADTELTSRYLPSLKNAKRKASSLGPVLDCTTGQVNCEWPRPYFNTSNGSGTGDFTMLVVANPASVAAVSHLLAQKNDAAGSPFAQAAILANADASGNAQAGTLSFFTYSSAPGASGVASASVVNGAWRVFAGVRRGGAHELWADGSLLATSTLTVLNIIQSAQRYTAIGSRGNGTTDAFGDDVQTAAAWNRALSGHEMWMLRDPASVFYTLIARASQEIVVPIGTVGSAPTLTTASAINIGTTSATARVTFSR